MKQQLSEVIQGFWRLNKWQMTDQELNRFLHQLLENEITTMDHADIYGDYTCEGLFGRALNLSKDLRERMQIVTKCGIVLPSKTIDIYDYHKYDYSRTHIMRSVERSLKELQIESIDLLLLHRPSPLLNPEEVADTLDLLKKSGKVNHFGVSNFKSHQFDVLKQAMDKRNLELEYNQLEISPLCIENIEDGTLNHMLKHQVDIMAWSPLAGGKVFEEDNKGHQLIKSIAEKNNTTIDDISYQFINKLPNQIHAISGSKQIDRTLLAKRSIKHQLNDNDWFEIYKHNLGRDIL